MAASPVAPAAAAVTASGPGGFTLVIERTVKASSAASYAALLDWGGWWSSAHSWSGEARNIVLDPRAGGCLCERWAGGEAAHGRVLMAQPGELLRLDAPLGPLQGLPVTARLSFTFTPAATGSVVRIEMRVAGDAAGLAAPVNGVMTEAADRLARRIDGGVP